YQMRIEPAPMLDLLWKNPIAPRSVVRSLETCAVRLTSARDDNSPAARRTLDAIDRLVHHIRQTDWEKMVSSSATGLAGESDEMRDRGQRFLEATLAIHHLISDGFLNHQIHMDAEHQPLLFGPKNAL